MSETLTFKLIGGAGGGNGGVGSSYSGGDGAQITATYTIDVGTTLYFYVGGDGSAGTSGSNTANGGANGGGDGGGMISGMAGGSSGGGATHMHLLTSKATNALSTFSSSNFSHGHILMVASGGGGASVGGYGGGSRVGGDGVGDTTGLQLPSSGTPYGYYYYGASGESGYADVSGGHGGGSSGGIGGNGGSSGQDGDPGSLGQGGNSRSSSRGGGGGSGFYGGGGGGVPASSTNKGGSGGGGSSFVSSSKSLANYSAANTTDNASVTIEDSTGATVFSKSGSGTAQYTIPLTLAITSTDVSSNATINTQTIGVKFTTNATTADFSSGDISLNNCTVTAFSGNGTVYDVSLSADADGACSVDVCGGVFTTSGGTTNTATDDSSFNWIYADTTNPTLSITSTDVSAGATINVQTIGVTFTISESTTDFSAGDISLNNCTISNFTEISGTVYDASLQAINSGSCTVDVCGNAFTDAAGNSNVATSDSSFNWNYAGQPNTNICFPAGTPVLTDQGKVAIDKLNASYTIRGKAIVGISQTINTDDCLVSIEKGSLYKNVPSEDTLISANHGIMYQGKIVPARKLLGKVEGVSKVPYKGDVLYNVLMEKQEKMVVNNMIVETLNPKNVLARLYNGSMNERQKEEYIKAYNAYHKENKTFESNKLKR